MGCFGKMLNCEGPLFYTAPLRAASRGNRHTQTGYLRRSFHLNWRSRLLPLRSLTDYSRLMAELLNNQDIKDWLKKLPEWDLEKKTIERLFEFDDFTQAMDFVNSVAEIAEEDDHHPDIDIRYSKVRIALSTHSEGGLTDLDFELAEKVDTLVDE